MHVGETKNEALCKNLFVGGWKLDVVKDEVAGEAFRRKTFSGIVKMEIKDEQTADERMSKCI